MSRAYPVEFTTLNLDLRLALNLYRMQRKSWCHIAEDGFLALCSHAQLATVGQHQQQLFTSRIE
ncbi:hypothetical protein D3C76_1788870 [compost metagenome]